MKKYLDKMSNKTFAMVLVTLGVTILIGVVLLELYQENEKSKKAMPYLAEGERIEYFDLLDADANPVTKSSLERNLRPTLIFIFSRPCTICDKNIVYWRKMCEFLKDKADCYGIILEDASKAFSFAEEVKLNFRAYIPMDLGKFVQQMRIKLAYSQTILYAQNQVKFLKLGDLDGKEATEIINMVKGMI